MGAAFSVRIDQPYAALVVCHVSEGQSIMPGAPLLDLMMPDGLVETVLSEGWGIVGHIEGAEDGENATVYQHGSVICHIVPRSNGGNTRKTGLHPRNATGPMMRRLMGLAPR